MAQSGYGYAPLQGYHHPQPPYTHQPYPAYPASPYSANGPAETAVHRNEGASKESYNHNRNVIPGLGLGFSSNGAEWQSPWTASQPGTLQAHPQRTNLTQASSTRDPALHETRKTSIPAVPTGQTTADTVEEGEISEGELEDIYEPRGVEASVDMSHAIGRKQHGAVAGNGRTADVNNGPSASYCAGRERSGSYSPYLSPREIGEQLLVGPMEDVRDNAMIRTPSPMVATNGTHVPLHTAGANEHFSQSLHVKNIAEARKQAQDAILRLWPLNVRYQHYIDEGVDEALLGDLFKELGFEAEVLTASMAPKPGNEYAEDTSIRPEHEALAPGENQEPQSSEVKPTLSKTQDKSEERKDRIARLLAAKGSKPSSSAPPPVAALVLVASSATTITSPSEGQSGTTSKTQSEKSKLLHQKMEALRKAREARGQKRPHPDEAVAPNQNITSSSSAMSVGPVTQSPLRTEENQEPPMSQEQRPDSSPGPNEQPPPPIPGLFLSSTPQPSQPSHWERPDTSSSDPSARPFKRPFGQTRESRPFLIDVSDDEDDAEMDIDSPEQPSLSIHRPVTPSLRTTSFRSGSSLVDNTAAPQNPSPIPTPPGMTSDGSARDDLQSMNKKIEAMKRKIAEAEARKKAKLSRQPSPAFPPLNGHSQDDSSEVASSAKEDILPPVFSVSVGAQDSRSSTQPVTDISPIPLSRVSDVRHQSQAPERRSRSCSATERLPLVEARRREQQLKLQLLRSQVASIEKEIQRSLQEEKRLREDDVSPDDDDDDDDERTETLPAEPPTPCEAAQFSPTTEAMDTTTTSFASNEDFERGRRTTPTQTQGSYEKPIDVKGSPKQERFNEDGYMDAHADAPGQMAATAGQEAIDSTQYQPSGAAASDAGQDAIMQETGESNDGDLEDASDSYEPPDVESPDSSQSSPRPSSPFSPAAVEQGALPETNDDDMQGVTTADLPAAQQISTVQETSVSETGREAAGQVSEAPASDIPRTNFVPYETPLQYFRAYRFHPEFSQSVSGGLRSLTYSNKIDVKKEVCPDQLAGRSCPRGDQCEHQHFENMQAPDDQILLQLGAYGNYEETQKQEYIAGLRQLLTDFRTRKVKDFQTISQGIIDYRARFLGDKSKILPLGNVSI